MRTTTLLVAGALILSPAAIVAHPGQGGGGPHAGTSMGATPNAGRVPSPDTAPGQGQFNGQGYNHMHTQAQAKGQPNQSCETLGTTPGNAASAPGGGSPFSGEDSKGGSHYAGSQKQNSRNSASVSQYDVACANQPH
jgi:hypothetical protein